MPSRVYGMGIMHGGRRSSLLLEQGKKVGLFAELQLRLLLLQLQRMRRKVGRREGQQ
jgi:hypothetical protein